MTALTAYTVHSFATRSARILTFPPFWTAVMTALVVPDENAKSPFTTPCTESSDSAISGVSMV